MIPFISFFNQNFTKPIFLINNNFQLLIFGSIELAAELLVLGKLVTENEQSELHVC